MSDAAVVTVVCAVFLILFWGTPDLLDALIHYLMKD